MKTLRRTRGVAFGMLLALPLLTAQKAGAQFSDNFDGGSMGAGWNLTSLNPALVSTTFVDHAGGKAVRLQANPVPNQAPAVGGWYRDEELTDFVVAVDLANWPGTGKNQAFVVQGRGTLTPNPAEGRSMIMNYDTSQYGENPTDRRQGQFQINMVNPGFATRTLAVAELTLQPGRSYRLIFKAVGADYTAMVYDYNDLTAPVMTLRANDVTQQAGAFTPYTSGKVGILGFSRQGTSGTVDLTFDNFYAGAADPNLASGTALSHPIAGTPVVTERVPAERFKNFFDRSGNITFTAKTHNDNVIDAAATKMWLNGVDVSSQLTVSENGTTITGGLPGSALAPNTAYAAEIEVVDVSGTKRSRNTFWFDTFTDAFVSTEPVKAIEAEDYNYFGGEAMPEPIPVSGMNTQGQPVNGSGVGYWEQGGYNTLDYFDFRTSPESPWALDYRSGDRATTAAGVYPEVIDLNETQAAPIRRSDNIRARYAQHSLLEYILRSTEAEEWVNYTRTFAEHNYRVYLRVGSFGATTAELHDVTGDITLPDQSTVKLGTFNIPNFIKRHNFHYVPLVDDAGAPVSVALSGRKTVRLWMKGQSGQERNKLAVNYILFVPEVPAGPPLADNFDSGSMGAGWNLTSLNPALVSTTFVDHDGGKAVRLQANPVPNQAPAVGGWYRDEELTDFVVAVDLVNWQGTDKNQAFVVQGRGTLTANPAEGRSMIMNYDTSQYGENPTDRRQGQFQINMVNPGFATRTLAVAEMTLQPGRSYRFVFKGIGPDYTAMVYDYHDFTQPLMTLRANDVTQQAGAFTPYTSGRVGILGFSRQGTSGTVDLTYDNFYVGATDPNLADGTALSHPIAGTPVVVERTPAQRFKNFFDRSGNITFAATTYNENLIDAAATKLWLNGVDVSSGLAILKYNRIGMVTQNNGPTITASYPGSALAANRVYSAEIEVVDVSGTKRSKNTFWFDTFTDAFVSTEPVKAVEAEDYNYFGGEAMPEPIPVSGMNTQGQPVNGSGVGYWEQGGYNTLDYFDFRTSPESPWALDYRSGDRATTAAGVYPEVIDLNETQAAPIRRSDNIRARYAQHSLLEYILRSTEAEEWVNYTRTFAEGNYRVYLRTGSFGATTAELHEVTGDITLPDQTTVKLGTFNIPNMIKRHSFRYVPLVDENGAPATVSLSGRKTVRLWMKGNQGQERNKLAVNYILFVPHVAAVVELRSATTVNGTYATDATGVVDAGARTVTIPIPNGTRFFQLHGNVSVRITDSRVQGNNLVLTFEQ